MSANAPGRSERTRPQIRLQGVSICPGVGMGSAVVVDREPTVPRFRIPAEQTAAEIERYEDARRAVRSHLRDHIEEVHGGSWRDAEQILRAHESILEDEAFHGAVRAAVSEQRITAAWALDSTAAEVIDRLEATRSPYLEARAEDVRDLRSALLDALAEEGQGRRRTSRATGATIQVSSHLSPSDVLEARNRSSPGFATESRALLSHAAILLRGFGIPAVGGVDGIAAAVEDGDVVIVDGTNGVVIVRPDEATLEAHARERREAARVSTRRRESPLGARTKSGVAVRVMGNIDNPAQVALILDHRLEGIGLFRTEFLVLEAGGVPSEDEQREVYRRVIDATAGSEVVIRTFDIGGDKRMAHLHRCSGANPALGIRGVRRQLRVVPDELDLQLRAICRAAGTRRVSIMVPMVTTLAEVRAVKQRLGRVLDDLRAASPPIRPEVRLGVMIEVPAAAIATGRILDEVDFVSVGSNDLLQYFMASDRDNERTVDYLDPENEEFLWLLGEVARQAWERGRETDLSICGELASQPKMISRLLDLGFRCLSISPVSADAVRSAVASSDVALPAIAR